jgi:hypothetical protein
VHISKWIAGKQTPVAATKFWKEMKWHLHLISNIQLFVRSWQIEFSWKEYQTRHQLRDTSSGKIQWGSKGITWWSNWAHC